MITEVVRKPPFLKQSRKTPYRRKYKRWNRRSKLYRSSEPGTCLIQRGTITWRLPRKYLSLNVMRARMSRFWDTKHWERDLEAAECGQDDKTLGKGSGKRLRLEVVRISPQKLDRTNLAGGSVKGIEDALVRLGYLVDDSERWLQGPFLSQEIGPEYLTIIRLMAPKAEEAF